MCRIEKTHPHKHHQQNRQNPMRSFEKAAQQYAVQYRHDRSIHERASTLMPACKIRLLSVTSTGSTNTASAAAAAAAADAAPDGQVGFTVRDGFFHMARLREALNALDRCGWKRSYHQRMFHEEYLRAATRVFFKTEKPGSFERAHKKVLEINGWDSLQQEILISTPRRFGKTISISLFCAALMFACPAVECSIYSTCKRISQKLLRNVCKFLDMIYTEMKVAPFKVHRRNQEELNIQGPEGQGDMRTISSYPSKVRPQPAAHTHTHTHTHTHKHTHTQTHASFYTLLICTHLYTHRYLRCRFCALPSGHVHRYVGRVTQQQQQHRHPYHYDHHSTRRHSTAKDRHT
jgi:hypothetical protein